MMLDPQLSNRTPNRTPFDAEPDAVRRLTFCARWCKYLSERPHIFDSAFALDDSSCFNGNLHRLKDFMDNNSATREHIQAYIC